MLVMVKKGIKNAFLFWYIICRYPFIIRAPDKLRICVFYDMKTSKNASIIRSECTHYAYILLCKQTFQIRSTGARGTDHPPFSNFLFTNLFSIKFLYFFIISSLFPYFNLFVSIFIQSYLNIK